MLHPELSLWPILNSESSVWPLLPLWLQRACNPVTELNREKETFTENVYLNQEWWVYLLLKETEQLVDSFWICSTLHFFTFHCSHCKKWLFFIHQLIFFPRNRKGNSRAFFVPLCGTLEENLSRTSDYLENSEIKAHVLFIFELDVKSPHNVSDFEIILFYNVSLSILNTLFILWWQD